MSKRVTITKHDFELIEWLVKYYKDNSTVRFPAYQNLNELLKKVKTDE